MTASAVIAWTLLLARARAISLVATVFSLGLGRPVAREVSLHLS